MKILFVDLNLLSNNMPLEVEAGKYDYVFGILESQNLGMNQKLAQDNINKVDAIAVAQTQSHDGGISYSAKTFVYSRTFSEVFKEYLNTHVDKNASIKNIMANALFQTVRTENGVERILPEWCPNVIIGVNGEVSAFNLTASGQLEELPEGFDS